ncbi:S8 family serine peptidase [Candidatus Peregrinibacteria bacterium]|nr:MAG: S8 family serine peptidase [Candidatus Peregrinibacteria bacterium]
MKNIYRLILTIVLGLFILPSMLYANQEAINNWTDEEVIELGYVPHELVVEFDPRQIQVSSQSKEIESFASTALEEEVMTLKETLNFANAAVFYVGTSGYVENYVAALKANPLVASVTPNYVYEFSATANDPHFTNNDQWGLRNHTNPTADIDIENAWNIGTGGTNKIVALLDTGVAYDHPDLATNMWGGGKCRDENGQILPVECKHGWDYVNNDRDPRDDFGHGTHMAGIIAAETNNGIGIAGINQNAKIMVVKIGNSYGTFTNALKGIQFARNNKATIINASFGGVSEQFGDQALVESAIQQFGQTGIFVAGAGNSANNNDTNPFFPASFLLNSIISVAASDRVDNFASSFSNWGAGTVDVFAPGNDIWSTYVQEFANFLMNPQTFTLFQPWYSRQISTIDYVFTNSNAYTSNISASAITRTFDLSGNNIDPDSAALTLNVWCDTEMPSVGNTPPDYIEVFISPDGTNWSPLQETLIGDNKISEDSLLLESTYDGYPGKSSSLGFIISPSYFSQRTQFKFEWITDGRNTDGPHRGCYLSNLRLRYLAFGESGQNSQSYVGGPEYSGTSQSAAFVTGITALVWNTFPQLTPEQVRYAVVNSGDPINNIHPINGQQLTVTGRRVNAYKAMLLAQELNNDRLFLVNDITVRSTSAGGNWNDPATWVGGAVPTSTDVVEINGNVTVNANVTVSGMLISPGTTLYAPGTGSQTLNINGSRGELQNKGTIDGPSGQQSTLTIHANTIENTGSIYGNQINTQDLYNRGNITNVNTLQVRGTLRHQGTINNCILIFNGTNAVQQLFSDAANPLGDVVFDNDVNVTGSLAFNGTSVTISAGKTITLPPGSTVRVYSRQFYQYGTLAADHLVLDEGQPGFTQYWESATPFVGQTVRFVGNSRWQMVNNVTLDADATVESNAAISGGQLAVYGHFNNQGNLSGLTTLIAYGNFINSGTAVLHLRAHQNVTQNGQMMGGSITFEGGVQPQTIAGTQPFPYAVLNGVVTANENIHFGAAVNIGPSSALIVSPGNTLQLRGLNNSGEITADHLIFESGIGGWAGNGLINVDQITIRTNAILYVSGDKMVRNLTVEPNASLTTNENPFYRLSIDGDLVNQGRLQGRLHLYLKGNLNNSGGFMNLAVFAATWDHAPTATHYEFQLTDSNGVWQAPLNVATNSYSIYSYVNQTNLQWRYRPVFNVTPGNWSTPHLIN